MLRAKLNMADIWTKYVATRLITSWLMHSMFYDVADKHYLRNVLKERIFLEISEELSMTCSRGVKFTIYLSNLKL